MTTFNVAATVAALVNAADEEGAKRRLRDALTSAGFYLLDPPTAEPAEEQVAKDDLRSLR